MNFTYLRNIMNCIIVPILISGITCVGMFFFTLQSGWEFTISFVLFLSGVLSFLVGSLIRSVYKWEKIKIIQSKGGKK